AGWLSHSEYEWAQHNRIGLEAGLSQEEIDRVKEGGDAAGWSDTEKALLVAVDEVLDKKNLSDTNWEALTAHYNEQQILDIIFTAGNYALLAMALNTLGVEVDDRV
ncbi:MAG: carboxymuconolactone decarboxylase family protein, partial [Pseudomonadota bacterium]|nr:carboxymuconolactone decarboxylase family protein [Pseudomonadota bacterium]